MITNCSRNCKGYRNIFSITGLIIFGAGLLMTSVILFARGDSINPSLYSIESKPHGLTYGEWAAKWEQWLLSTPANINPATDETGKYCAQNQNGPVWFLAGTPGGSADRTCTIPAGKAIFFSIINNECSYAEHPTLKSESDLAMCARAANNQVTNLQTIVGGVNLQQLEKYRVTSPLFNLTFPANNVFGAPVGTTQAVVDGFYIFLQPLTGGKHEVDFSGLTPGNPTTGTTNFAVDVKYHLKVQ